MPVVYKAEDGQKALFDALIDAKDKFGAKKPILEDQDRNPLSYTDLIRASFALGRKIAAMTKPGEHVGVLLPSGVGAVVVFFALHAFGRVPTMLNFTAGLRNIKAAVKLANVKHVLTAHKFIELGKLHDVVDAIVVARTALRVARGEAKLLPLEADRDGRGVKMQVAV